MKICSARLVTLLACIVLLSPSSRAQSSPNDAAMNELAKRTAGRVLKGHFHRVLVLTMARCVLDADTCGAFDQKLRTELAAEIPDVTLFSRAEIMPLLTKYGLIPVDAYTSAAEPAAVDVGADIMITESLTGTEDGYELTATLTDLTQRSKLDDYKVKLKESGSAADLKQEPLYFREPKDGPAVLMFNSRNPAQKGQYPKCEYCPEPTYPEEARSKKIAGTVLLVVTVTEQGTAQQIGVVRGLGGGLTDSAAQTVGRWRFKPAAGPDGKAITTRTPIQVRFALTK